MSILQLSLSISTPPPKALSSARVLSGPDLQFLVSNLSNLSINNPKSLTIRNGGGPRTFPGGVSKWQWKRMQAKKQKQLLQARLVRERQIYEMRKRAELRAAVSDLERPWEVVQKPPALFSVSADEQLKVLADRFQRPGGFDFWSEKDGPQLFDAADELPSARFFPKGVVHSTKPYGKIEGDMNCDDRLLLGSQSEPRNVGGEGNNSMELLHSSNGRIKKKRNRKLPPENGVEGNNAMRTVNGSNGGIKNKRISNEVGSGQFGVDREERVDTPPPSIRRRRGGGRIGRGGHSRKSKDKQQLDTYDMSLQQDGSYVFGGESSGR